MLHQCDMHIGQGKNIGEKKTFVLLQLLDFFHPNEIYVFCSDDYGARKGIIGLQPVFCMSILAAFYTLRHHSMNKKEAFPYFETYTQLLIENSQTHFKVWKWMNEKTQARIKVPFQQVFEDIYAEKFELLKNGELRYLR